MTMVEPLFDYQFRLILIGDSTVGKSSLLKYFTDGRFAEVSQFGGLLFRAPHPLPFSSYYTKHMRNMRIKYMLLYYTHVTCVISCYVSHTQKVSGVTQID